jgi:hypothetical protein
MANDQFEVVTVEGGRIGSHLNITSTLQVAELLTGGWPRRGGKRSKRFSPSKA